MTATADASQAVTPEPSDKHHPLRPGTGLFTLVMAAGMAVTALGVDTVLPAFPEIREAMGLTTDSNEVAGLITFFLLGNSIGLLPAGLLADRFGRRPVMIGGLGLYIVGAVAAALAPSLAVMYLARFVWGLGSAGPRVAVMAMVRDTYSGEKMAKQMSFIMAVFLLVPTFAPALAAGLLALGPWQIVFWLCVSVGAVMLAVSFGVPETLAPADQTPLSARNVYASCRTVLAAPGTLGYLVSLTALFGVFLSYLASSESIVDQVFGLEDWFPLFFGGIAMVMGISMFVNGRIVERFGLDRLCGRVFMFSVPLTASMLILVLATDGTPPFWPFVIVLCAVLFGQQMLIPNLNAAAMGPLAPVAGTAAAILGMVPGALGSLIGMGIDRQFNGTVTPLAIAFVIGTLISLAGWRWAVTAVARSQANQPSGALADVAHL